MHFCRCSINRYQIRLELKSLVCHPKIFHQQLNKKTLLRTWSGKLSSAGRTRWSCSINTFLGELPSRLLPEFIRSSFSWNRKDVSARILSRNSTLILLIIPSELSNLICVKRRAVGRENDSNEKFLQNSRSCQELHYIHYWETVDMHSIPEHYSWHSKWRVHGVD